MPLSRIESLCHNPNLPPSAPPFQGVTTCKWASKLYTGGAGFESLVRFFSVVSSSPSRYRWYTIYNQATSASSHTFPIHYLLNILVFDAIHSVPDSFVNPLKPNYYFICHHVQHSRTLRSAYTTHLCVFTYLRTSTDYLVTQIQLIRFYNRDRVFTARYELGI